MVDLSQVPLIPDGTGYTFPEDTIASLKKLFPEITDKKIQSLAHFMGEHIAISQVMDKPSDTLKPNMGRVAAELCPIQEAAEALQTLLSSASEATLAVLGQAYTFQKRAPSGITDKRYPDINDVLLMLTAFNRAMQDSDEARRLVEYRKKVLACKGKAEKAGSPRTADDFPQILLDGLNEILCPDGGKELCPEDGYLGQDTGLDLAGVLGLSRVLTKNRVVAWRRYKKWQQGNKGNKGNKGKSTQAVDFIQHF